MSRDLLSGLAGLAVAAFAALQSRSLQLGTLHRPGPGFFPFWGAVMLGVLSLILIARALRRPAPTPAAGARSWTPLVVAGALLVYVLLLEPLGFVTVTFLFLLLLFRLTGMRFTVSALSAITGAAACYALFQLWLKTQLPRGPWGF